MYSLFLTTSKLFRKKNYFEVKLADYRNLCQFQNYKTFSSIYMFNEIEGGVIAKDGDQVEILSFIEARGLKHYLFLCRYKKQEFTWQLRG